VIGPSGVAFNQTYDSAALDVSDTISTFKFTATKDMAPQSDLFIKLKKMNNQEFYLQTTLKSNSRSTNSVSFKFLIFVVIIQQESKLFQSSLFSILPHVDMEFAAMTQCYPYKPFTHALSPVHDLLLGQSENT
jgi:hypothetical protein